MESLDVTAPSWRGRTVFVTGHTGFKGSWLSLWLSSLGAKVYGYSTSPPTEPNLFSVANVGSCLTRHVIGDVRNGDSLKAAMTEAAPEVVFHLAAQPLVRRSYSEPVETYATNVMGTVNLLEAVRSMSSIAAVVNVTTDKCYENREWVWGYRESEAMGGHDPYSSSKACSELITAAYRNSFFPSGRPAIASARAGNVIGGGDWAPDRLLPDFFRAATAGQVLDVRYPNAVRPWQHVLEPLSGYLRLAEALLGDGAAAAGAYNFGPSDAAAQPVSWLLDRLVTKVPGTRWQHVGGEYVHEAGYLKLDSSKARGLLDWEPRWNLMQALDATIAWHAAWREKRDMRAVCLEQIAAYQTQRTA